MALGILAVAASVVVAVWAFTPRGLASSGPSGPALSIAVVAPVEPLVLAGDVLEVGRLTDGFDREALDRSRAAAETGFDQPLPDAYVGEDWPPLPLPVRAAPPPSPAPVVTEATVTTTDPLADGSRNFGFDRRPEAPLAEAVASPTPASDPTFFQ